MTDWTFDAAIDAAIVADETTVLLPEPKLPDISKLSPAEREAYQAWWERFQAGLHSQERKRRDYLEVILSALERREAKPFTEHEGKDLLFWNRRLTEVGAFE